MIINPIRPTVEVDSWGWRTEEGDAFTVKSAYSIVSNLLIPRTRIVDYQEIIFKAIWKCQVPSKVAGFVWLVLLNRVPTRDNLIRRRVIPEDGHRCCVFCGENVESVSHLFLYCGFVLQLWERVFAWLGFNFSLPHSISSLLNFAVATTGSKQKRKGMLMIWNVVLLLIWRHRNRIIFDNGVKDVAGLLEDVKTVSWKWWNGILAMKPCLLYEWIAEPAICLSTG
jgi:hypothetical protein